MMDGDPKEQDAGDNRGRERQSDRQLSRSDDRLRAPEGGKDIGFFGFLERAVAIGVDL